MELTRRAPQFGIVCCLVLVAALLAPYLRLPAETQLELELYYASGLFGVQILGIFALVALVILGAGLAGRTEPDTAAGAALVIGLVATGIALQWAFSVPPENVLIASDTWTYHRFVVVAASLGLTVASALYARAIGVL
jgi:hypothetical protein